MVLARKKPFWHSKGRFQIIERRKTLTRSLPLKNSGWSTFLSLNNIPQKKTHTTRNFISPNPRWQEKWILSYFEKEIQTEKLKMKRYTSHKQALQQTLETLDSNVNHFFKRKHHSNIFLFMQKLQKPSLNVLLPFIFSRVRSVESLDENKKDLNCTRAQMAYFITLLWLDEMRVSDWLLKMVRFFGQ